MVVRLSASARMRRAAVCTRPALKSLPRTFFHSTGETIYPTSLLPHHPPGHRSLNQADIQPPRVLQRLRTARSVTSCKAHPPDLLALQLRLENLADMPGDCFTFPGRVGGEVEIMDAARIPARSSRTRSSRLGWMI